MWFLIVCLLFLLFFTFKEGWKYIIIILGLILCVSLLDTYEINFISCGKYKVYFLSLIGLSYFLVYSMRFEESWDQEVLLWMIWLGSSLIVLSNHLILTYLALELQTFSAFVLIASRTFSIKSGEGALKYFILGAISSGFFLLSLVILYHTCGDLSVYTLNSVNYYDSHKLQVYLLLLSMLFKLSLFPIHFWAPDVYEASTNRVIAVIGTLPKISVIGFLVELNLSSNIILWCSLGSMLVGTFGAINQTKIKRLLAYSGITHMGMALMTLSLFSKQHVEPILLYIIVYIIGFLGIVLLMNFYNKENFSYLYDLSGLHQFNIVVAISWSLVLLSAGGIPPLSGFLGKWWVIWTMFLSNYVIVILLSIFLSVISVVYYLRITQLSYFQKCHSYVVWERVFSNSKKNNPKDLYLDFTFYFICFLIIKPGCLIVFTDYLFIYFF